MANEGKQLNQKWKVGARHALYNTEGRFFMMLERFPGALFDPNGYLLFPTKEDFESFCQRRGVSAGKRLNVDGGIASHPAYIRVRPVSTQGNDIAMVPSVQH
jgi:hypothetical protein